MRARPLAPVPQPPTEARPEQQQASGKWRASLGTLDVFGLGTRFLETTVEQTLPNAARETRTPCEESHLKALCLIPPPLTRTGCRSLEA